jgi:hypothetical protein
VREGKTVREDCMTEVDAFLADCRLAERGLGLKHVWFVR